MHFSILLFCILLELGCVTACNQVKVEHLEFDRIVKIQENDSAAVLATFQLEQLNDSVVFISDYQYGQIYCVNINSGKIEKTMTAEAALTDSLIDKYGTNLLGEGFEVQSQLDSDHSNAENKSLTMNEKSKYRIARRSTDSTICVLAEIKVPAIRNLDNAFLWVPCATIVTYDRTFSTIQSVTLLEHNDILQPQTSGFMPIKGGWMVLVIDTFKHKQGSVDSLPIFESYSSNGKALGKLIYLNKQDARKPRYGGYFVTPISIKDMPIVFTSQQGSSIQYLTGNAPETKSVDISELFQSINIDSTTVVFVGSPIVLDESTIRLSVKMRENRSIQTYYVHISAEESNFEIVKCFSNSTEYLSGAEFVTTPDGGKTKNICTILYKKEYGYYLGFKKLKSQNR